MGANKLVFAGLTCMVLGACAAVTDAIVEIETTLASSKTPRLDDVPKGLQLTGSDRPRYTDLYEMEAKYSGGLVNLPKVQEVLDSTLKEVTVAAGYPDFDGKIYVIGDPNDLHAQASREGNIFISLGFLRNIQTQEELTNLVAHEFAHIALQHHQSDVFNDMNARLVTALNAASKLQVAMSVLQDKGVTVPNQRKIAESFELIEKARFVQDLVSQVASPTWNRQQELAADQVAADISSKLNHKYTKASLWLPKLAKIENSGNSDSIKINRVNVKYFKQMVEADNTAGDKSKSVGERVEGVATRIAYEQLIGIINYFSITHSDSKTRYRLAKLYQDSVYPDFEPITLADDKWAKVFSSREFTNTIDAYLLADEAVGLASSSSGPTRKQAEAAMKKAEQLSGKGHIYIWSRKVDMYEMLGNRAKMQAALQNGTTAGLKPLVTDAKGKEKLATLISASLANEADTANSAVTTEKLAEINRLRDEVALPVFDDRNNRRLPNVRMLLDQSDLLLASGQREKAKELQKKIFDTYQRPGFIYPKMILMSGTEKSSKFSRLEAERLNLECGFLHPQTASLCENSLAMLN